MVLPCKFSDGGCKFVGAGAIVKKHEDSCSFRMIGCPTSFCKKMVPFARVKNHIRNIHGAGYLQNRSGKFRAFLSGAIPSGDNLYDPEMSWAPSMTVYDGETFLINAIVKDHNWSLWVVIIGDKKIAQKYSVSMRISGLGEIAAAVTVWGNVYSIEVDVKDILDDWKGVLEFNKNMLRKLDRVRADGTRSIAVEYELRKK